MPYNTLENIILQKKNPLDIKELNVTLADLDKCFGFENLETLNIIGQYANPLPQAIMKFKKLHTIQLNDFFPNFPVFLAEMPQLKNLILPSYYSLQSALDLPDIFDTFTHLENLKIGLYFDIDRPDLKFPCSIFKIKNLKKLHLTIKDERSLPKNAFIGLDNLEELCLSYGGISKELQENIFSLKNLKEISLNGSFTYSKVVLREKVRFESHFSEKIINLKNLQKLVLTDSKISETPDFLKNLTSLKELDLTGNDVKSFPFLLSEMPNLIKLNLSVNKHLLLDKIFEGGEHLRELKVTSCNLKSIPQNIENCLNLEFLNVSNNKLSFFPDNLLKIPNIKLKIDQNNFANTSELKTSSINNLIASFKERNLPKNLQKLEFCLIQNHTENIKNVAKEDLLTCLYVPDATIRINALMMLENHIKMPFSLDLDPKTTLISVLGKISGANMTDITKFFREKGYKIINKIDPKTTHICISEQSKASLADVNKAVLEQNIQLSLPKHLKDFQQLLETPYLLDTDVSVDMTQNVGDLLKSNNADNQQLALQIMETGGIPEELMYVLALMVIEKEYYFGAKFDRKSQKISKLLQKYAPTSLQALVAKYHKKKASDIFKFVLEEEGIDKKLLLMAGLQYNNAENVEQYSARNYYDIFFKWGMKQGGDYLKIIYKTCLKANILDFSGRRMHTNQLFREELLAFPEIEIIEVGTLEGVSLGYTTNIPTIKEMRVKTISNTTIQRIQKVYSQLQITIKERKMEYL